MHGPLLTAAQMRALEQAEIDSGRVTGLELMERAGRGAVDAILDEWPELVAAPGRAVVLCGPGNNGGDGFVVARLLAERGWDVECFLYGEPERLPPDARTNYERWTQIGSVEPLGFPEIEVKLFRDYSAKVFDPPASDATPARPIRLLIDALFGTGLTRPLSRTVREVLLPWPLPDDQLDLENPDWPKLVALDIPSGLCADSGRFLGADYRRGRYQDGPHAFHADLTVTFHAPKAGHVLHAGPQVCGRLMVADIGLHHRSPGPSDFRLVTAPEAGDVLKGAGHKYDHGHALILSGGMARTGAARLAARAALRVGAGLVTVGAPGSALMECAAQMTAIMLRRCDDGAALKTLLEDARLNALCLGPGLGTDERAAGLVAAALEAGRPTVLDADAITLIAGDASLRDRLHPNCVLTPHMGEFARLCPDLAQPLQETPQTGPAYSKIDAASEAGKRLGVTLLLKGPDTVISSRYGNACVHSAAYGREAPWLATAGAGDVLAGLIAGLLARGHPPQGACEAAAWLHVEAARRFGPGLIAEDLPEMLPAVLKELES